VEELMVQNMAAVYQLPTLFVCENNMYATEVPFAHATRNPNAAGRAASYGLPGLAVDGNDVLAVHEAAGEAVARAREGGGPTLLECKTYRTRPHAEGMRDTGYRTAEEIEAWKARDPIRCFREQLLIMGTASADEFESIEAEVRAVIEDGLNFATHSPWPDPATALDHIFSTGE
jgi:2-oxoisovalerate dehydrogenase E1 component